MISIEEYSSRSVTKTSDRLPAISGYAHETSKAIGGSYLAGLWENDLVSGLLWVVQIDGKPVPKASGKRAPSWSWAGRDDQVSYYWPLNRIAPGSLLASPLKLVSRNITLAGLDTMGEIVKGVLVVSGPLRRTSWIPPPLRKSGVISRSSDTWYRLPDFEWGKCLFDCHNDEIPDKVWCLVVAVEEKSVNCLVLGLAASEGEYRRVGFARLRRVKNMKALLSSFQQSTVTIV